MRDSRSMSLDSDCKRGRSRRSNSRSDKRSPYRRRSRSRRRSHRRRDSRSNSRLRLKDRDAMYKGRQSFRDHPRASKTLGVFNLGRDFSQYDLRKVFERYGRLLSCHIVVDRELRESRGFGFVTFQNIDDAIYAKKDANEIDIGSGERIRIDYSITRTDCYKREDKLRSTGSPRRYNKRRQSRSGSRQRYSSSRSRRRYSRSRSRRRRDRSRSNERYSRRNRYSRSRSRSRKTGRSQYSRDRSIARGRSPSPYLRKPSKSVEKEESSSGWSPKKEGSSPPAWSAAKKESSPARW